MQQIGAAKKRVLEIAKRNEKEAQSMLTLVRNYLLKGDLEGAREAVLTLNRDYRQPAIEMLKEHPPKTEKCEKCGNELKWLFKDWNLSWWRSDCATCDYKRIKTIIKEKCPEIMAKRGIPKRYLKASPSDTPQELRQQIKTDSGMFLWGAPGTGKTHFMAANMRREILNTKPIKFLDEEGYCEPNLSSYPLYISVPELLLKIRGTFKDSSATDESEIIKTYSDVKFLYLDDLGVEKVSDWALQTIYLIIDRRYSEMLRTIISSNFSLDQLTDRLDDRIASRIAGMCKVVHMKGKDRRLSA